MQKLLKISQIEIIWGSIFHCEFKLARFYCAKLKVDNSTCILILNNNNVIKFLEKAS